MLRRDVGAAEVFEQRLARERFDRLLRPEDRAAERMAFPEMLREQLVHQVVGRVLDHLDFFEDDFLLALDLFGAKTPDRRTMSESRSTASGRCSSSTLM